MLLKYLEREELERLVGVDRVEAFRRLSLEQSITIFMDLIQDGCDFNIAR